MSDTQATETTQTAAPATPSAISGRTWAIILVVSALMGLFYYLNLLAWNEELSDAAYNAVYIFGIMFSPLAAVLIFWVARAFDAGSSLRAQWTWMGWSVAIYAVGDFVWTYLELFRGLDPYPSIADVFYTLEYAFFLAAIILAVRSYRKLVNTTMPLIVGAVVSLAAGAAVYALLLQPYILPAGTEELGAAGLFVSVLYPVGDVFFMFGPAIVLALVVSKMGGGRFAWPWWIVVIGAAAFALTDSVYSYVDWAGSDYLPILDIGWIAANMLFAFGALIARDVNEA